MFLSKKKLFIISEARAHTTSTSGLQQLQTINCPAAAHTTTRPCAGAHWGFKRALRSQTINSKMRVNIHEYCTFETKNENHARIT